MKRILSLFAIIMAVTIGANAQDFTWKDVSASMTSVPENYYEGATKADAEELLNTDFMAEGAIYGAKGSTFSVLTWDEDWENFEEKTLTWDEIIESDIMFKYPAAKDAAGTCTLDENANISDNYQAGDQFSKLTLKRSMKRYLSDGTTKRWHTIAFPFEMSAEQIEANFGSDAKLMKLTSISENILNFETAISIEEDYLYLLQIGNLDADVEKIELENVTMTSMFGTYGNDFDVMPVFEPATLYGDDFFFAYYIMANNELHFVDADVNITATKWYIQKELEDDDIDWDWAKILKVSFDGEITSVSALHLNEADTVTKRIENNRVVIRKGNKSYTTTGIEVK